MYVKHTFLSKTNTIVRGEKENLSLNPIMELSYGGITTRGLIFFDTEELKALHNEKVYPNLSLLSHRLKMFNTGSIQHKGINKCFPDQKLKEDRQRAISFDLIFFTIPEAWDAGRGFDYTQDIYYGKHRGYSEYGSNWFNARTNVKWETYNYMPVNGPVDGVVYDENNTYQTLSDSPYYEGENMDYPDNFRVFFAEYPTEIEYSYYTRMLVPTPGIYSTEKLDYELEKFNHGEESIIVGVQHFDYGNENIDLDITDLVNSWINDDIENNKTNLGIGIAFAPCFENDCVKPTQYVGFFTGHTNSFFEPYVETIYHDRIIDDRANFYLNKTNRLYLHSIIGGKHVNLDGFPLCTIDGTTYGVNQAGKGIYYADIENFTTDLYEPVTMFYDEWSNIAYKGRNLPNVEKFFTTKSPSEYYNFGLDTTDSEYKKIIPNIYGINNGDKLRRENLIMVNIEYVIKHTKKQEPAIYDSEYRIYTKQGEREIPVIDWQPVHCDYIKSYFFLDTKSLVPSKYFVDIKCHDDFEETVFRKQLEFYITDEVDEIEC